MGIDRLNKAIFLDRDGVINRAVIRNGVPHPPANLDELEILAGVNDALNRLREAGYLLIVVTNQPDVARGAQTKENVESIHSALMGQLQLDEIRVCYHDDVDLCECRKPAPGLLLEAAQEHQISLTDSYLIGDRWKDIEAGRRAGCTTIFIDYGYCESEAIRSHAYVKSLSEAAGIILAQTQEGSE